jgi:hypothetical protein
VLCLFEIFCLCIVLIRNDLVDFVVFRGVYITDKLVNEVVDQLVIITKR